MLYGISDAWYGFACGIGLSLLNYGNEFYGALGSIFNATPTAFGSLFVIVVLGSIMSTADSLLSALSSHIVKGVIKSTTKSLFYCEPVWWAWVSLRSCCLL